MGRDDSGLGTGALLVSFLLGGMVGAGIALLVAPQSGADARRKLHDLAENAREKATDYVAHTKEAITSSMEKGKEMFEGRKSAITSAIEAGKQAYEHEVKKEKGA
ncbi:MAG: YtxH domain-containing protein [Dissulfurispiraceae bacterium]|jgi:gas vesicle protein|nr:YtxH domain-containing protein [Dissulfurispiraceae bacterium]